MKGIVRTAGFQDWWSSEIGKEINIEGIRDNYYITDKKNPNTGAPLLIFRNDVEITDNHPILTHLSDETLLREVRERNLKLE